MHVLLVLASHYGQTSGEDLKLTLDAELQRQTERVLAELGRT